MTVIRASIRNVRTCRSDVKGAGQAGGPRKTLSTEAEHRGGVARSSEEGSVMGLERRVVRCGMATVNRIPGRTSVISHRAAGSVWGEKSRMKREFHVRFCEGAGVQFPCATRP